MKYLLYYYTFYIADYLRTKAFVMVMIHAVSTICCNETTWRDIIRACIPAARRREREKSGVIEPTCGESARFRNRRQIKSISAPTPLARPDHGDIMGKCANNQQSESKVPPIISLRRGRSNNKPSGGMQTAETIPSYCYRLACR